MDLRQALVTLVYTELTTDPALKALFLLPGEAVGTVRMVNGMPLPDTEFPYLTHRFALAVNAESWAFAEGVWYLDIWDHDPNSDRLHEIRARVITLMDWQLFEPPGGESVVAEFRLLRDEDGPTDAADVFRLMTQWELHLDRQVEVEAILTR